MIDYPIMATLQDPPSLKEVRDTEVAFGKDFLTSFSPMAERTAADPRMCLERDHSVCVGPQVRRGEPAEEPCAPPGGSAPPQGVGGASHPRRVCWAGCCPEKLIKSY